MQKVSVAIIEKEGRILIAKRETDGPLKGLWEFPGGKIEPGEAPGECVRREVLEELGLTVQRVDFLCTSRYHYEHEDVELFAFMVQCEPGEQKTDFYRTIKWVKPYDLRSYNFPEANVPIIQKLVFDYKADK